MQPFAQRVKSYIKDTNHFLNEIKKIGKLLEGAILSTMHVVGLYPNIPHGEGLASLYRFWETRANKQMSSDTLAELAEIVLKNNIFEFDEKTFLMLFFIWLISRKNWRKLLKKNNDLVEVHIDETFFIWEHGEESLRDVIDQVNLFHPTIKLTAEYSKEEVNFLDLNIILIDRELKICLLNLQILISF